MTISASRAILDKKEKERIEMSDLMSILTTWVQAISSYKITDFWSFITAILQAFGFQGEFTGPGSMADYADWIVSLLGPLGDIYGLIFRNIDTATFVKIVNAILAYLNK